MNPFNIAFTTARIAGQTLGYQLVVELSDHSIDISMERPDKTERAWDDRLYKSGNVFLKGYANPIKPSIEPNDKLENHDEVDIEESNERPTPESQHVSVISSSRFKTYMKQDLISQLLTPKEQWRIIAYAVGALALLMFINVAVSMSAAGML